MSDDEFQAALLRLLEEWNKSEEYLKIAEQVSDKAILSSINELRYAGRKVLEAFEIQKTDKPYPLASGAINIL